MKVFCRCRSEVTPLLQRPLIYTLMLTALLCCNTAKAEVETLVVGADSWPPFRFVTPETVTGIDHELWKKLSKRIGFKVHYLRCPWKRCLRMMKNGQIDAMSGLAWREERAEYITYAYPHYYSCSTQLYLPHGKSRRISKHRDMHAMTIGMVGGSAYYTEFDQDTDIYKKSVTQEAVLPNLLLEGRIDSFIGTDCQADYELASRGLTPQIDKAVFKPGNKVDLFVGLSSNSRWALRKKEFDQALQQLREEDFEGNALKLISPFAVE
ncbi:substrate-binding periplasmic protein [Neptuniibacter sp. PT8_73]|uniref:substrate-binding periplasmic protein n=1 Tax=Neptuniibacter sp. PT8_73 TaxID=3398206 RepID=UPI0039F453BA